MWERNALYKELKVLQSIPNTSIWIEALPLSSETSWWSENRLLKAGKSGADVLKLQKALKNDWGIDVNLTSRYDEKTVKAVKKFQGDSGLEEDGIAGPFTQAMIFESNYSFALPKPVKVQQNLSTCWAAAYQSALPLWPGRTKMNVAELLNDFKQFTDSTGAINIAGLKATARNFNATVRQINPIFFKIETVKKALLDTKSPVILIHFMFGNIGHAEVVFGFEVKKGLPNFLVMDPLLGEHTNLTLAELQNRGNLMLLVSPN